jgi:nicotinamidase-related amidase
MLIDPSASCLLVVDAQERLVPKVAEPDAVVGRIAVLLKAAARLNVPILASEQYRRGLGPTVPALQPLLPADAVVEKLHFSCLDDPGFAARFGALGRTQAVVAGAEAHVCVLQTVERLLDAGTAAFVVADATSSRDPRNHTLALERLRASGAAIVSTEMVVFEWLGKAGTPEFRELSALIK